MIEQIRINNKCCRWSWLANLLPLYGMCLGTGIAVLVCIVRMSSGTYVYNK